MAVFRWHKPIKSGHKLFLVAMYNYLGLRFGESIYFIILKISSKGKTWGYYRSRFDRYLTEISLSKRSNRQYS